MKINGSNISDIIQDIMAEWIHEMSVKDNGDPTVWNESTRR